MRLPREKFICALESVKPGISPEGIVEQSSCFVFNEGKVYTFNDEVCCHGPSLLDKAFSGAIPGEKLLAFLHKLKEEEIQVEASSSEFAVISRGKRAWFTLEKEINMPLDMVEKAKEWKPLKAGFLDAVNLVQQCAGKNQPQFFLNCVHLSPNWLEACDQFQLCRWQIATGVKESTLVRQTSLNSIVSLGVTECGETESWIHFRNTNGVTISCRRYLQKYPDLTKVLNTNGVPITLPKYLAEAAERANIFSEENIKNYVIVELIPGKVKVESYGISGRFREIRKSKYQGEEIKFLISPQLLIEITKNYSKCTVSKNCLKAEGDSCIYLAYLFQPDEIEIAQSEKGATNERKLKEH